MDKKTRIAVGGAAGTSLTYRWVARGAGDLLEWLGAASDSILVALLLSIAEASFGLETLGPTAQVCLYAVGTYLLLPRIVPDDLAPIFRIPRFRFCTTAVALGVFSPMILGTGEGMVGIYLTLGSGAVLVPLLFSRRLPAPLEADPVWARTVWKYLATAPEHVEEVEEMFATPRRHAQLVIVLGPGLVLVLFGTLLGMLLIVLDFAYPLAELAALVVVVVQPFFPERTTGLDVERPFYTLVSPVFQNLFRGFPAVLLVLGGVLVSALPLLFFITVAVTSGTDLLGTVFTLRGGYFVLLSACAVGYSVYGLWYWRRVSRRLPLFLRSDAGIDTSEPSVTRPVGAMVPPTLLPALLAVSAPIQALLVHRAGRDLAPLWFVAAISLGVLSVGAVMGWSVKATERTDPQAIESERRAVPLAFGIQAGGGVVLMVAAALYEPMTRQGTAALRNVPGDAVVDILADPLFASIVPLVILFYTPDITRRYFPDRTKSAILVVWIGVLLSLIVLFGYSP